MSVSRFFGATTREALRQVRLALGPDALIVSNRRVNGGVEILATDQTHEAEQSAPVASPPISGAQPSQPTFAPAAEAAPFDLQQAVGDLRGLLETRMDEMLWGQQVQRAPVVLSVFQRLLGTGFSTRLLRAMLKHLPAQLSERAALDWCRNELIKHLPVDAQDERALSAGAVVALVGPTGVGKTTTIAKLAARCVRRLGAGNVVLVTTDTYRIGAHEQLRIYGRMMGVPVHVAEGAAQLATLVREAGPEKLVLIDNIGVSQRDHYVTEQAAMLAGASPRIVRLLALNAASHGDTLDEVARRYLNDGGPRLSGCLITKVDEAGRVAPVLDTCIRYRLPIHYVSTGQKVPEDLLRADAAQLIDRALSMSEGSALYAPTQADLALLMASQAGTAPKQTAAAPQPAVSMENLLALLSGRAGDLRAHDIESAAQSMDEHLVTALASEAFQQWQSAQEALTPAQSLAQVGRALPAMAADHAVVLSGQVRLGSGAHAQTIRAALLAAPDGQWLSSPWQCWLREDGWLANDGNRGTHVPTPTHLDELLEDALAQADLPHVRVLDERPATLQPGYAWLASCAPRSRWQLEGEPELASVIAKQLLHQPLHMRLGGFLGASLAWDAEDLTWWAAQTTIASAKRQEQGEALSFFSLKAQSRKDGTVLKHWVAVGTLQEAALAPEFWGRCLLLHAARQAVLKVAALHWQWLAQRQLPSVQQAGVAVQLALATAHMLDDPALSRVLHALAEEGKPNMARLARASCKLFELKRMLPA